MGHYSTARVLFKAGAYPSPPRRLFRNIWDPNELKRMVKNFEKYFDSKYLLPLIEDTAAAQFQSMDEMSDAEGSYRRALEGKEKVLGRDHPHTLATIYNLASLLRIQKRYNEASVLYLRASEELSQTWGPDFFLLVRHFSQDHSSMIHEMESQDRDV